jgi:heterodisulfide reductase subunit A-like polyferredoxin
LFFSPQLGGKNWQTSTSIETPEQIGDRNLMDQKASNGAVMVMGAGIAGMQAALDLANSGYLVKLVEKSPAIGGVMSELDKTFPTNDCSM